MGNITSIKENGTVVESYTYDSLNQLKTVTRGSDVWEYTYDNGGNILSVKKNGVVEKSYTYGDTEWKDLLTNYNGTNITYDAIGNPLSYRDGMSFTWADGRKLTAIVKGSDSISYTYNANGLRNSKTVNGTATQYYWLNGILQGQKTGSEYMIFLHDENGTAYGFMLKNGTTREEYYYIFNAQGDVIGILDNHGTQVVKYTYNAWGELLSTTGTKAETIGAKNPIRYRGYYYDSETGFYYLQSRYYDPITQRFVNADGYVSTGQGILATNMFAYCGNNAESANVVNSSSGKFSSVQQKATYNVGNIPEAQLPQNVIKYSVPLYNQLEYKVDRKPLDLCWAFCQVMIEDYQAGVTRTNAEATIIAIQLAKSVNGQAWNRGAWPTNNVDMDKNPVFASGINSLYDLYHALVKDGPMYGYYWDEISKGDAHLVVITGVNLSKGTVYTNNPWNFAGEQTYSEFLAGVAWYYPYPGMPFNSYMPIN